MILRIFFLLLMFSPFTASAEANPELWPYVKERLFQDRVINEADFLTISGPRRASSGAQVPITIKLDTPKNIEMKNVFLIIDALVWDGAWFSACQISNFVVNKAFLKLQAFCFQF